MAGSYDPSLRCRDMRIISSRQPGLHGKVLSLNLNNKVWKLKVGTVLLPVSRPYLAPASFPTIAPFLCRICYFSAQITCDRTSMSLLSWPFIFLCATIISWVCPFLSGTVKCTRLILCSKSSPRVMLATRLPISSVWSYCRHQALVWLSWVLLVPLLTGTHLRQLGNVCLYEHLCVHTLLYTKACVFMPTAPF